MRNTLGADRPKVRAEVRPEGEDVVILHLPDARALIRKNGDFWVNLESKEIAKHHMRRSESLTRDVREHWRDFERRVNPKKGSGTFEHMQSWINVHPYKSWGKPDVYPSGRQGWETGEWAVGNTYEMNEDCWLGDVFLYAHFNTPKDSGAIILWHEGGDVRGNYSEPEVWIGDFDSFLNEQDFCDWQEPEGFAVWDRAFDGGLMWGLGVLGSFDGDVQLTDTVLKAIVNEPDLAVWPINQKILRHERSFPPEVVQAVRKRLECHGGAC